MTGLAAEVTESSQQPEPSRQAARGVRARTVLTLVYYVLGAFLVTVQLWVDPASRWQIGDIQDVNQATWFMRYTATAIEHFRLPALLTSAMNAPHTVNMMWNTSLLLPGSVVAPVTLLFGPQVALTVLLVIGMAGSAASMLYVLRRWGASLLAAGLGGALYGFSPALVNSGIGHYSLELGLLLPLLIDRLMRIVTGRGSPVRNGIWLGVLAAAQLFISEEALVDTILAAVIMLAVMVASRPHQVRERLLPSLTGLATAGGIALVLCARGLWVQFHGVAANGAAATVVILYNGRLTNLGTLPYAFITPARSVLLHTASTAHRAAYYPQPTPEYLAYLGIPLIIVLLAAIIYFWRDLTIRVAGLAGIALEWMGMGAKPRIAGTSTLPSFLLPWQYLQHLPMLGGMVPDRLAILADLAAAVVLAFAIDRARSSKPFVNWRYGAQAVTAIAVLALLPLIPAPYQTARVAPVPAGWQATFAALHLTPQSRVLLAPFPYSGVSEMLRYAAATGEPATMNGGDFIQPDEPGRLSRAGRAGMDPLTRYIDGLYSGTWGTATPSPAVIKADLAEMDPAGVVAVTTPTTAMGRFLIQLFGPPTTHIGQVLGWRL
ncbi:MAG TPA: hypothetical protein VEL03_15490 [Streptosporangiaceae bacterium]|nr:hypothetical protein [Streptosporangiaceae bacterium]